MTQYILSNKDFVRFPVDYMMKHGFSVKVLRCNPEELLYEFYKMHKGYAVNFIVRAQPRDIFDGMTLEEGLKANLHGANKILEEVLAELDIKARRIDTFKK